MKNTMSYKDYIASIEFDSYENFFSGRVIGVIEEISFEGRSVSELKKAFANAVEEYLKECKEEHLTPVRPYLGGLNITISTEMHRMVNIACAYKNMTQDDFVRHAIDFTLLNSDDEFGSFYKKN